MQYCSLWLCTVEKLSGGHVTTSSIALALCHRTPLILLTVGGGWPYNEHWMLAGLCVATLSFCAVEQVLDHFQDRFIRDVDAKAIVNQLQSKDIISFHDLMMVRRSPDQTEQNQILHDRLRQKCTKKALMTVCEVISAVQGNAQMKALGADMKRMLEGKCHACSCKGGWRGVHWVHVHPPPSPLT